MDAYPINIRFNDLDTFGHVNNAIYLSYFEEGRKDFFQDKVGMTWDWEGEGILLARNEIDYKVPLRLNDKAQIEIWVSRIGNKSLEVSYRIFKSEDGSQITCTTGKSVLVCFDYKTQKSVPVPDEWREIFGQPAS
jgi:acyl-CoA thioester hydrolase